MLECAVYLRTWCGIIAFLNKKKIGSNEDVMSILKWLESKEKVVGRRVRKEDALFVVCFCVSNKVK